MATLNLLLLGQICLRPQGCGRWSGDSYTEALPLRLHDNLEVTLAAGEQEAAVISPGGSLLATVEFPGAPTHALSEDFSNDGLTDIVLVSSSGVYGFVQTRQPGALFSTLVGCLLVVMGIIFVSQHLNPMKRKPLSLSGSR